MFSLLSGSGRGCTGCCRFFCCCCCCLFFDDLGTVGSRLLLCSLRIPIPGNTKNLLLAAVVLGRHSTLGSYLKRKSTLLSPGASYKCKIVLRKEVCTRACCSSTATLLLVLQRPIISCGCVGKAVQHQIDAACSYLGRRCF